MFNAMFLMFTPNSKSYLRERSLFMGGGAGANKGGGGINFSASKLRGGAKFN